MFKPGDLVRVREEAISDLRGTAPNDWVIEHGWLWVLTEVHPAKFPHQSAECFAKSLATGAERDKGGRFMWFADELEKADVQEG